MIGGTVIENSIVTNTSRPLRRLWCVDRRRPADECAVYAEIDEAVDVRPGDWIWWQSGKIYWTRHRPGTLNDPEFVERPLKKVGGSFDPRGRAFAR